MSHPAPIYLRVRDEIASGIAAEVWRPGEAIPSEMSLADELGIAPGTVRRAIDTLVEEGLVERQHGRGTFVRRANFDYSLFRYFLSDDGAAAVDLHPGSRVLAIETKSSPSRVAEKLQIADGAQVIYLRRLRSVAGQPMLLDDIWLPLPDFEPLLSLADEFGAALYPVYERSCGQYVAFAEETLSAGLADSLGPEVQVLWKGQAVITVERLAFSHSRRPIEWRSSCGPANRFRYKVVVR